MNSRTLILIAAALIAAGTAVMVRNRLNTAQGKTGVVAESNRILVAKRDLSPGNFINAASDIDWAEPTGKEDTATIREGTIKRGDFNGGVVRRAVKSGQPVSPDQITKAGDGGFLSAVLEPGMRAVAIAVTATTGAAGFIAPGDRVDLIVTHRIKSPINGDAGGQDMVVSETFVRDVRVVAVDQSLDTPEAKAAIAKNVTVEVNEGQAEQISVASEMGKISLSLRSSVPSDKADSNSKMTRDSDVSRMLERKANIVPRVQVIRGQEKEDLQFLEQGR